jgi:hypothetical protein
MSTSPHVKAEFIQSIKELGFTMDDDALYLVNAQSNTPPDPQINFHIENAKYFEADAVYIRKQLNGSYKPQIYLYDFTDILPKQQNENKLTEIQKKLWSSGEIPLACIFYNTEVSIIDCTQHIIESETGDFKPVYLTQNLNLINNTHALYNSEFAIRIKTGLFWDEQELKNNFQFHNNSAYNALIKNIQKVIDILSMKIRKKKLVNQIIIQSILIKYLEERIDSNGKKLLSEKYFQKYKKSNSFNDVLKNGYFTELLNDLNHDFNGNVFKWSDDDQRILKSLDLSIVADLLSTKVINLGSEQLELDFDWRYFEFKLIPVELISRLYETFLGEEKRGKGLYFTPSHLVKLLVDECIPLKQYEAFDLENFTTLDPACGSGIFLVTVFKKLVQIWRLQNDMKRPKISNLKMLLGNLYGIDKEEQAVKLSSFSLCLALCNELDPLTIITELGFDDLCKSNLIHSDFFDKNKLTDKKFDLIIGNPPFIRNSDEYSNIWQIENKNVEIPLKQVELKFLVESFSNLKPHGLSCLIIKASGLLYNNTSNKFKIALFENYNVNQIFDFTALARNKSLWENGVDVATAAIFIKNEKPDYSKNILHLTFRRTKATAQRIIFEIDDYDLHFVNRQTAICNEYIWKINLLGGGRIKNILEKAQLLPKLKDVLKDIDCQMEEGYEIAKNGEPAPDFMYKLKTLPTEAIKTKIDYSRLRKITEKIKLKTIRDNAVFKAPNLIIKENIGNSKLPVFYNEVSFSFQRMIISIFSKKKDSTVLKKILHSFETNNDLYRFYIYITSGRVLISKNTVLLKKDLSQLRFTYGKDNRIVLSASEKKIISNVNEYFQDFIRHGENSKAVKPIEKQNIDSTLLKYGNDFIESLNNYYKNDKRRFRLSDVVYLENSFIAAVFRHDTKNEAVKFHTDFTPLNITQLTANEFSSQLSINRIIRLYPKKDVVVLIKPNQYRYWISLTAYRDADKYLSDLMDAGY